MIINKMTLTVPALSINEAFARSVVSAFILPVDPTIQELADVKTAVSEAVTNAVIHGYGDNNGIITIRAQLTNDAVFQIEIEDKGKGISDIPKALTPLYTSAPHLERSGMGFTIMEQFTDNLVVDSKPGEGTKVRMVKKFNARNIK